MALMPAENSIELQRNLENLQRLVAKFKNTVEGLFIHGSCSFWSVYGGLEKAQDDLWEILCFGLNRKRSETSLRKGLSELLQSSLPVEHKSEQYSLQDWIKENLLNYSMSAAVERDFLKSDNYGIIQNLYQDFAAVRNSELLKQIVTILQAVEQNNLALLGNVSPWLVNKALFVEEMTKQLKEKDGASDRPLVPTTESKEFNMRKAKATSQFYTASADKNAEHYISASAHVECSYESIGDAGQENLGIVDKEEFSEGKTYKAVNTPQLAKNVLMKSALAAVMEASEDDVIWYDDADRRSLTSESMDITRSRLVHIKEMSRSETSLAGDKVTQQAPEHVNHAQRHSLGFQNGNSDIELSGIDEVHSDLESRAKQIRKPSIKRGHSRSKSDQIGIPKAIVQLDSQDGNSSSTLSTSLPCDVPVNIEASNDQGYYYQPEDGYMFPKPYEGQSLISYLNSRSYDTGAELDKENAHFSICEALITAIEQIKCSTILDSDYDTSDEEIETLRQKIQERKLKKKLDKLNKQVANSDQSRSDTGKSSSSMLSTSSFSSSRASPCQEDDIVVEDSATEKLSRSWENLTFSSRQKERASSSDRLIGDRSICTEAETSKPEDCSAEAIAKSLLKKFSSHKLPAASELKWVVSEDEVPQSLLPFPTSWPVSPDDAMANGAKDQTGKDTVVGNLTRGSVPRFRGSLEWAPPRPQIVFALHPVVKRKAVLQKQSYRCAGCGLKVSPSLSKRFRYCEYFGKYFCTSCHQNQTYVIPARILLKWDFKRYHVSDFALDLLKRISSEPLFDIDTVNPSLFKNIKAMGTVKELGIKLHYIRNFLQTCRHTAGLCRELNQLPAHLFDDRQKFSLDDLVQIKRGELIVSLKSLIANSVRHIRDCQLCKAKGFVCEFCNNGDDILYPFETNHVVVCSECKTCFHVSCFVIDKCPKCIRLQARERMRVCNSPEPNSSS